MQGRQVPALENALVGGTCLYYERKGLIDSSPGTGPSLHYIAPSFLLMGMIIGTPASKPGYVYLTLRAS